jgi:hypothetical protein
MAAPTSPVAIDIYPTPFYIVGDTADVLGESLKVTSQSSVDTMMDGATKSTAGQLYADHHLVIAFTGFIRDSSLQGTLISSLPGSLIAKGSLPFTWPTTLLMGYDGNEGLFVVQPGLGFNQSREAKLTGFDITIHHFPRMED